MRLKTKLVLATTVFTTVVTVALCSIFFTELLRGRIVQAEASNDVLVHELLLSTRNALEIGLAANAPTEPGEDAFERAVAKTLQNDAALDQTMNAIVLYSPTVQDVYITGTSQRVLVSTDPTLLDTQPPARPRFSDLVKGGLRKHLGMVFGGPKVMDESLPLQRNGRPFLFVHIGVRSTLLRNLLAPWLHEAAIIGTIALLCSLGAAIVLAVLALRPIERVSSQLEELSTRSGADASSVPQAQDAEQRVSSTISRIDAQIRTRELQQTNLSKMLQTLKDGVMLFTSDGSIAMASDSVHNFITVQDLALVGRSMSEIFPPGSSIGDLLHAAFLDRSPIQAHRITLEDNRTVEVSLDFPAPGAAESDSWGAMLTLHDAAAQEEIEREIELSRRLASIGRLTAGVGHEVKNPINAMVLHLELLRSKLGNASDGAARHVEVLASEMARLDRVVQTLADFSRPMEPTLAEQPLSPIVDSVLQLISAEAEQRSVHISVENSAHTASVVVDAEMLRQALLNIVLNAMEAMPEGGNITVRIARERSGVLIAVRDSGTGIPPDTLNRIFHLYFTTKATGSGIGLAMTWRMVQMLGGTIDVESNADPESPQRGTLFVVRLPLATRQHLPAASGQVHA